MTSIGKETEAVNAYPIKNSKGEVGGGGGEREKKRKKEKEGKKKGGGGVRKAFRMTGRSCMGV